MRYPPYPRYKPSGVEWLGEVPEHWEVRRLKFLLTEALKYGANEAADLDDPDLPRYIRITDIDESDNLRSETFRSLPEGVAAPYLLREADILFARSGATAGKTFLYRESWGKCAYAGYLIRARLNSRLALPAFVRYYTASHSYWQWLSSAFIQSTIQNVSAERYADLWVPIAPIPEQRAIADFLDAQTAKLDTLVAKKRALIEKLKEKRAALISRVVTRGLPPDAARAAGLDPHPKLKPSGVEWLGEVPEGWEVRRIKTVARVGNGSTPSRENSEYWADGSYPWLNSSVANLEEVFEPSDTVTEAALQECHLPRITPPAVLVGITGEGRTRGMATTLRMEATINQHLAYVKPSEERCNVDYLRRVLDRAYLYLRNESEGGGSTKGAITCGQIANVQIPMPPLPEQRAIADYLDRETARIDELVAKVEEAIERLREYRSALITAAVTGRIDVRAGPRAVSRENLEPK